MRILYGVCGEGMGHATRSAVCLDHLAYRGHELLVAASDQAAKLLARSRHSLVPIVGLGMRCEDGALDLRGTLEENARRLPAMLGQNASAWTAASRFRPEAVITDYDSFAWLFARSRDLPVVSIDNAQILPRCLHERRVLGPHADGMRALETFTNVKAPDARHYIVTSFFFPPLRPGYEPTTSLVPPILRRQVVQLLGAPPARSGRVLIYKTSSLDDASMLRSLAGVPEANFIAYGLNNMNAPMPLNVTPRPFDEAAFLRDVVAARAVVGNGGMSLIGEALAFGKPIYAVPVRGQFEQVLNAAYLQAMGYGMTSETLDPTVLRMFLAHAPRFEAAIRARPQHDENALLYRTLDGLFPGR
jgi:uncharacterized protein (TIGR00661 family)